MELKPTCMQLLRDAYGERLQEEVPLARYTAARLGGPADALLVIHSVQELVEAVTFAWRHDLPFVILGGGSNVLVSDAGVRSLVVLNRARKVKFDDWADPLKVWAESGANFGALARQAARRGFGGLEWAAGIPGTLGGAVVGNAGAHGSDMASTLSVAEILHRSSTELGHVPRYEEWSLERFEYSYRDSILKQLPGQAVVLAATLRLERSTQRTVQAKLDEFVRYRRRTQPPGASMGSMFKNPPGDYAGRLIEDAGLKGYRVGSAQISTVHANFFLNLGEAGAVDIYNLIQLARRRVAEKSGVELELEVELLGDWSGYGIEG